MQLDDNQPPVRGEHYLASSQIASRVLDQTEVAAVVGVEPVGVHAVSMTTGE